MGKGGEKGEVGGIEPWLLGDIRPCVHRSVIQIRHAMTDDHRTFCYDNC